MNVDEVVAKVKDLIGSEKCEEAKNLLKSIKTNLVIRPTNYQDCLAIMPTD